MTKILKTKTSASARIEHLAELAARFRGANTPPGRFVFGEIVALHGRNGVIGFEMVNGEPEARFYEISPVARPASRRKAVATAGARS
jgi:ribosomal protein L35AE/L33A